MFFRSSKSPEPVQPDSACRRDRLTLRIKHRNFLRQLDEMGVPREAQPVTGPLCGELIVSYAFDTPGQFIMATPPLLQQAGIDRDELDTLANANFKGKFSAQLHKRLDIEGLILVRTGNNMEAVMLVFDGFWDGHVKEYVRGDIVVSAPHRDHLLIADSAVPDALEALQAASRQILDQTTDAHGLSAQLMLRQAARWVLWQPR